jgi:hypothetical protein
MLPDLFLMYFHSNHYPPPSHFRDYWKSKNNFLHYGCSKYKINDMSNGIFCFADRPHHLARMPTNVAEQNSRGTYRFWQPSHINIEIKYLLLSRFIPVLTLKDQSRLLHLWYLDRRGWRGRRQNRRRFFRFIGRWKTLFLRHHKLLKWTII